MEKFDSITHFLQSGDFDYRVFDMGRKVISIPNREFQKIEAQEQAYPYPFQQKAWMALLFWSKKSGENKNPVIWFLQLPIDEMGFLKQDARDGFLIGLLEQAGKNIQAKQAGDITQDDLGESPFAFKPQADRLAMFHALATKALNQPPSRYYQFAHDYLTDAIAFDQWQFLGLQGIADIVARLDQDDNEALLANTISNMPQAPLESFCRLLENVESKNLLAQALMKKLFLTLENTQVEDLPLQSMLVRASSGIQADKLRQEILMRVLDSIIGREIEILAAISGRAWNDLRVNNEILELFIANLATQNQAAFNAILADLMMLPEMRDIVLGQMRSPERSSELSHKLSEFMQELKLTGN